MTNLTKADLIDTIQPSLTVQDYTKETPIEGVQVLTLSSHVNEVGDFSELLRITDSHEVENIPGFSIKQINRSRVFPGSLKAWHLHLNQDEIWYLQPNQHLVVGLWDVRKNSKTSGKSTKISLGGGQSSLLFIPHGVAHGSINNTLKPVDLVYFTNQLFDPSKPDENRLPWDALGKDFWNPPKE